MPYETKDGNRRIVTYEFRFDTLFGYVFYLAIGLAVYMWLGIDAMADFSWSDPWLYVYMCLWPFVLIWAVFWYILIGVGVLVGLSILIAACSMVWDNYKLGKHRRDLINRLRNDKRN